MNSRPVSPPKSTEDGGWWAAPVYQTSPEAFYRECRRRAEIRAAAQLGPIYDTPADAPYRDRTRVS